MRPSPLLLASLLCAGCAGSPGSADGSVRGRPFAVAEAISATGSDGGGNTLGVVVLSSKPGLCDAFGNNVLLSDAQLLIIKLGFYDQAHDAIVAPDGAGDFPIIDASQPLPSGALAVIDYAETDSSCEAPQPDALGIAGKIALTSVGDDGAYAGTGNVVVDTHDLLKIEFSATFCNALPGLVAGQYHADTCK